MSDSQTDPIWGWRGATSTISQRIKRLLETGERSDIQFAVGQQYGKEQVFRAHKFVLSASSDVFDTMFYGKRLQLLVPQVNEKTIKLPDILPQAFGIMLNYMYTDVIDGLDLENALPTMNCATKYGLPLLVDASADYIIKNVDKNTCLAVLEDARVLDADSILQKCLEIVDTHCSDVLKSEDFVGIKSGTLHMLFSRETFVVNEEEIYSAAERWAFKACETNHLEPTAVNRRQMLGQVLFLIRFPLMDDGELANGPVTTGLLLKDELLDIYQFKYGKIKPDIRFSGIPRSKPNITFCDQQWIILDGGALAVARRNAFVDKLGRLHLRLSKHNGDWKGAGILSVNALEPGCYRFEIEGKLDLKEPDTPFALYHQIDNESGWRVAVPQQKRFGGSLQMFKFGQGVRVSILLSSILGIAPCEGKETEIVLQSFRLSL